MLSVQNNKQEYWLDLQENQLVPLQDSVRFSRKSVSVFSQKQLIQAVTRNGGGGGAESRRMMIPNLQNLPC